LSAKVETAVQGVLDLTMDEKMDLLLHLEVKQERVTDWISYFKTETTNKEFREEFKSSLSKNLLESLNSELSKGIRIPFSHTQKPRPFEIPPTVQFKNNMIIMTQQGQLQPASKKYNMKYEAPYGQGQGHQAYPVTFKINKQDLLQIQARGNAQSVLLDL
jgi:hypothetical protein